jgi:hypothetical protein
LVRGRCSFAFMMSSLALASLTAVGCAAESNGEDNLEVGESADDLTSVQSGLWVLEGSAQSGDIELVQLGRRDHASLVREAPRPPARAPHSAGSMSGSAGASSSSDSSASTGTAPEAVEAVSGGVSPGTRSVAPKLKLRVDGVDKTFDVKLSADGTTMTLKSTTPPVRELTYKRSYELYCVPLDPGTEATMLVEVGASPKVIGVNGDGRSFPTQGSFTASVQSDTLFRTQESYIVTTRQPATATRPSTLVTVTLPWAEMTKRTMKGKVAISGTANALPATPITCERVQ